MGSVGFIGLGSMGSALAANVVGAGFEVVSFDVAGSGSESTAIHRFTTGR